MRFYLVDKISSISLGKYAEGIKCVSKSEDFLEQHFPGYPVMPGVLIIESMAQLSGYLLSKTMEQEGRYLFSILSMLEKVKFHQMVGPGAVIKIRSEIIQIRDESSVVKTLATVEGQKVAEASMVFVFFPINGKDEAEKKSILDKVFAAMENTTAPFIRKSDDV